MIVDENTKICVGDTKIKKVYQGDSFIYGEKDNKVYLIKNGVYQVPFSVNENYNAGGETYKQNHNGYMIYGARVWSSFTLYPTVPININDYAKIYIEWQSPSRLGHYAEFFLANDIGTGADKPNTWIVNKNGIPYDTVKTITAITLSRQLNNIFLYIGDTIASTGVLEDTPLYIYNIWLEPFEKVIPPIEHDAPYKVYFYQPAGDWTYLCWVSNYKPYVDKTFTPNRFLSTEDRDAAAYVFRNGQWELYVDLYERSGWGYFSTFDPNISYIIAANYDVLDQSGKVFYHKDYI